MRSFGNFCVASVLGSSCATCTLRSCAPYAPINSSKYLCLERSLIAIFLRHIPLLFMSSSVLGSFIQSRLLKLSVFPEGAHKNFRLGAAKLPDFGFLLDPCFFSLVYET
ncbi:MAG: hypothetical protein LBJ16_03155 [Holosporaceae bacterium]|nr:hypothetical protein [Holosporaceae bacterium]